MITDLQKINFPRLVELNAAIGDYRLPNWKHNVETNNLRGLPGVEPGYTRGADRVAVVALGPSLEDTWHKIKDYKFVISCSGSHRFLVDRGIVPTWHVECDSAPHKKDLIGEPHPEVEYLIGSTCDPALFDHLQGHKVKIWQVGTGMPEIEQLVPPGQWMVNGGPSVGLRSIFLARFFGFERIDIYGMDCSCITESSKMYAIDDHPKPKDKDKIIEVAYQGKTYITTHNLLNCADEFFAIERYLSGTEINVCGHGLLPDMISSGYQSSRYDASIRPVVAARRPQNV